MTKFEIFDTQPKTYRLSDFDYELPEELIAQYPTKKRGDSRMLVVYPDKEIWEDKHIQDFVDYLEPGDCLVYNDTRVFPAKLMAKKDKTDATVEVFLLRELENQIWEILVKPARKVRIGNKLRFNDEIYSDVIDNTVSGGRVIRHNCSREIFMDFVMKHGHSPLPPYIRRKSEPMDRERYQTIFAKKLGAVAAPTAGLHFDENQVKKIKEKGVTLVPITLHIGLGTFRPVMVEDLHRHHMDSEYFEISEESAEIINKAREAGNRIVAMGASVVRALESSLITGIEVNPKKGWTDKFIFPPYEIKVVDVLLTNLHQPKSTLLILVSSFVDRNFLLKAYKHAVEEKYRFLSYGDAMLIL
ncbi:MAG: tRNA preQ1(34) S-adenosylmethionine ribosyltransferase-isomerase QueA [Candidatus Marinimicrobia bacterium]|nr:tRNA preQ1(34) S-adenosylmethionine ribosyltransferase-isomerase QueA [Candidatus Neomarinimicrobiota bacterium]MDD5582994.1 tRNA preQ1(34) S-adenosylmethionine ribosyltransferase-isomerase QueA [Candidatus Neomarinimicrobiota bacterium]